MKPIIAITTGDINGIGYEVILKSLSVAHVFDICTPILYGNGRVAKSHLQTLDARLQKMVFNTIRSPKECKEGVINLIPCYADDTQVNFGQSTPVSQRVAYTSLQRACADLKSGAAHALVTAPIQKASLNNQNKAFLGHTEYLTSFFNAGKEPIMMMVNDYVKVGLVSCHIPLSQVASSITQDSIVDKVMTMRQALVECFALPNPRIAILALNPHCGEDGLIGKEESEIIAPAIETLCQRKVLAFGPYPADGFWGCGHYAKFDAVLALYHDQGLVPFKLLDMNGVNFTAGLPIIRTSPDHGVAYDIAGKNLANPRSFLNAIYLAADIFKAKQDYKEMTKNPLTEITNDTTTQDDDK